MGKRLDYIHDEFNKFIMDYVDKHSLTVEKMSLNISLDMLYSYIIQLRTSGIPIEIIYAFINEKILEKKCTLTISEFIDTKCITYPVKAKS